MWQVLQALKDKWLVVNAKKCVWVVPVLEYLGHKISASGVLPLPSQVAAIQEFPHQRAASFPRNGQHRMHAVAAHRQAAQQQEGLRAAGVVGSNCGSLRSNKTITAVCYSSRPPHSRGDPIAGRGRLGNAFGCVPPAAATWQEGQAAPGLLLKEARGTWQEGQAALGLLLKEARGLPT